MHRRWRLGSLLLLILRRYCLACDDQLYVMVADVIKFVDTVDTLGLLAWFRKVYLPYHNQVRLRFKLAAGLGEPWCWDGSIPQVCPLSMFFFIVVLCVPCCKRFEAIPLVSPQLCADNSKCSSVSPLVLFGAAEFTVPYAGAVGQDVSPGKCVLLSTCKSVRESMVSGDGRPWSVELDVRDLGGHLDFTGRAWAGTLCRRVKGATHGVAAVGALPMGFFRSSWAWFVGSICQLGCMLMRRRRCLCCTLFVLNLLDGIPCCLDKVSAHASVSGPPSPGSSSHFPNAGLDCSWGPWPWACASASLCCANWVCLGW